MKAVVAAFNQEKALVGAFSVIVQPVVEPMDRFEALFLIMNTIFREAIERLMQINPVAEHIDLKDHYLAFIDLEKFGIDKQIPDER